MNLRKRNVRLLVAVTLIAFLLLPLTILLVGRQQNISSKASPGTSLDFEPQSTESEPIEAGAGKEIKLDLMAIPGEGNLISFVKFVVEYDPDVLEIKDTKAFEPNTDAFPEILEELVISDGTVTGSVSIGSDYTKALQEPTKIGTLTLVPKKVTDTPTVVTYTADSQVLSVGDNDDINENVLSNTGAAFVAVMQTEEKTAPLPAEGDKESTGNEELVRERFPESVDPKEPGQNDTILTFDAALHGIGSSGDSGNPKNSSQSNKNPKKTARIAAVAIWDAEDTIVAEDFITLTYDSASGTYKGTFATDKPLPEDTYAVTITVEGYLTAVAEQLELKEGEENALSKLEFVAGDIHPDEILDIVDYNILTDCGYGALKPMPMDDPTSLYQSEACKKHESRVDADLDSNGIIDSRDFNLFLREFAAQKKLDAGGQTPAPTASPTPTKASEE